MAVRIKNYPIDLNTKGSRDLKPLPSGGNGCQSTEIKVLKKDVENKAEAWLWYERFDALPVGDDMVMQYRLLAVSNNLH
jgi:hypothetical protein